MAPGLGRSRAVAGVYLLGIVVNQFVSTDAATRKQFEGSFLDAVENIKQLVELTDAETSVVGATLLTAVDQFALNVLDDNDNILSETFVVKTMVLQPSGNNSIVTADSSAFRDRDFPQRMSHQIPAELVRMFVNTSGRDDGGVRAVAAVYYNIREILPSSRPGMNDSGLASGVVSTALQCTGPSGICDTSTVTLASPVVITFQHARDIRDMLSAGNITTCVFLNITVLKSLRISNGSLSFGQWSDRNCTKNELLSDTSVTVCECTHLTHFAILLSAAPLELSQPVTLSLEIIGYVGVSISLVAMAITVFTFIAFRSLHNMRNYIHINLCISLGIAQLTFVAGVDQSASDHVPIHCQVVAVLLHYFFLVSFMWMLMEGVVLYIVLVRVFVERKKMYILAFTVTSYGAPLLYLGLLTLPLGFSLPTQPNYGYNTACFLNPETNFIWAFIAPVLVIIVINIGFFIMAATIMWRHQKKEIDKTHAQKVKNWLRSAVSLVVIMGLTWILGVLIVKVEVLVPLAYIYTILVAFQGVFIFLIFVILSKQVREAYTKWWKVKVNESDFLSKLFAEKLSTSTTKLASQTKTRPNHESSENEYVMKEVEGSSPCMITDKRHDKAC